MSWWAILLLVLAAIAAVVVVVALVLRGIDTGFDGLFDDEEEYDDRNGC